MNEKEGNQDYILATWPYFQVTETLAHQALGKIPLQNIILTTLRIYLNVNLLTALLLTFSSSFYGTIHLFFYARCMQDYLLPHKFGMVNYWYKV